MVRKAEGIRFLFGYFIRLILLKRKMHQMKLRSVYNLKKNLSKSVKKWDCDIFGHNRLHRFIYRLRCYWLELCKYCLGNDMRPDFTAMWSIYHYNFTVKRKVT